MREGERSINEGCVRRLEIAVEKLEKVARSYENTRESNRVLADTTADPPDTPNAFRVDINTTRQLDLLICMDSNSKHINFRKLWTIQNSERKHPDPAPHPYQCWHKRH